MHIQPIDFPTTHGFLSSLGTAARLSARDITQTLVWDGNGFASTRVLVDRAAANRLAAGSGCWKDLTIVDAVMLNLRDRVSTPDQLEGEPKASFSAVDDQGEPWVTVEFYSDADDQFAKAVDIMWILRSALERVLPA